MFKVNLQADPSGTSYHSICARASYSDLVKILGSNTLSDDYKVSTEWILEDDEGNVATIYDWKETNLYDEEYPSVESFRKRKEIVWHIGAKSEEIAFKLAVFINKKLAENLKPASSLPLA